MDSGVVWTENTAENRKEIMQYAHSEFFYVKDNFFGECVAVYEDENKYAECRADRGERVFRYYKVVNGSREGIIINPTHFFYLQRSYGRYMIPNHVRLSDYELFSFNILCKRYNFSYRYYNMRSLDNGEFTYPINDYGTVCQINTEDAIKVMQAYFAELNITLDDYMQKYSSNIEVQTTWYTKQTKETCVLVNWLCDIYYLLKDGSTRMANLRNAVNKLADISMPKFI